MPARVSPGSPGGESSPSSPRFHSGQPKPPLFDRLRNAALKPEGTKKPAVPRGAYELTGEELRVEAKQANDKERAIGLFAGPVATVITFLVTHDLVVHDPPATLNGAINKLHVNVNTYYDLFLVLIVMSFVISGMALWRKRLYLGMVTALFGLAIFNLHYWGFGVPFVMVGAWYLVRAYRLQRNLKQSTADGPSVTATRPASNKRYTPPSLPQRRVSPVKPRRKQRVG